MITFLSNYGVVSFTFFSDCHKECGNKTPYPKDKYLLWFCWSLYIYSRKINQEEKKEM